MTMASEVELQEANLPYLKSTLRRRRLAGEILVAAMGGMAIGIAGAFILAKAEQEPSQAAPTDTSAQISRPVLADLNTPMQFSLDESGVLYAHGNIDGSAATRLASELRVHAGDIRTLSLNSPGGSLDEAMTMARLVREKGIATEVVDGAICASACPLLFAGGVERTAGTRAAIGVHQFYAPVSGLRGTLAEQALSDAQITTARVSRHLAKMGVDAAAWLHALDTPPTTLYSFSTWELAEYHLTTRADSAPALGALEGLLGAFVHGLDTVTASLLGAIEGGVGAAQQFLIGFAGTPFGDPEARGEPAA
jgi:hypothetical protein